MGANVSWGDLELPAEGAATLEVGTLRLVVERVPDEVRVRTYHALDHHAREEPEWTRWTTPADAHLLLRPAVPNRLVVVSHERRFNLLPNAEARLYVRIPLFAQLVLTGPRLAEVRLADEPSMILSDTWWGTYAEGELGYWLTTTARAEVTDELFLPHVAMCPFRLANRGKETLEVDRFAVRVPHLTVFSHGGRLWTDEVRVRYEGSVDGSEVRFGGEAPADARGAERIARPRVPAPKGFHARTFQRLRSLSGWV